ncbi:MULTISPECIES: glycosyltransferase [Actinoalloteichus]|uniref:Glycosyltransferase n=1 Tax=Actinoalloteichus fjordicus TaxID=1612552 RepID=A0AAC9LEM4_9PSEU|nr:MULTISPECIES: glycosyltransferase [Actinoalloteichus]APU16261.1 glycosyltransferase [Actinoalloteichus fjordicus]APU22321.1 glycosyltransferase [Actinoalloteichus sp. GBA129-24]
MIPAQVGTHDSGHRSRQLRVLHFSDTYLPRRDGIVTSVRTLMSSLAAAGHPSMLVVPRHPKQENEPGVLQLGSMPCGVAGLRLTWPRSRHVAQLAEWKPDLVHVHTPGPMGLLGLFVARSLNLPIVHTYHTDLHAYVDAYRIPAIGLRTMMRLYARRLGTPPPEVEEDVERRGALIDAINQLLLGDADAIVAPTAAILDRAKLTTHSDRLFVAPAGINLPRTEPKAAEELRAAWGIPPDAPVALFVGRINREKGIGLLAPAFAKVVEKLPSARLVLIGAVYERRWLTKLLAEHGITDNTIILGQQPPDVVAAGYAASQVFAFPSMTDTQGLVLQEAALAGRPSVLCDPALHASGPLGEDAVLAENTPEGFGAALLRLLADPAATERLGEAARSRVQSLTPNRYAEAMRQIYEHALR